MGGTGPCGPMTIIFGSVIRSLHIKFGAKRSFHVPKIPVYQFGLYGRYQILWTDLAHFQYQPIKWVIEVYVQIFKSVALCVRQT